jgi:hypothetical protein
LILCSFSPVRCASMPWHGILIARVARSPQGADWVAVYSQDYGNLFYHRLTGDSTPEPPGNYVALEEPGQ